MKCRGSSVRAHGNSINLKLESEHCNLKLLCIIAGLNNSRISICVLRTSCVYHVSQMCSDVQYIACNLHHDCRIKDESF